MVTDDGGGRTVPRGAQIVAPRFLQSICAGSMTGSSK